MEQLFTGIVVLGITIVVRRKEALALRWQPSRHTWVALGVGLLAFALSASLLLFETESLAARLIHYGGLYVVCGVVIPWVYTLLVEREACVHGPKARTVGCRPGPEFGAGWPVPCAAIT
jgi:drug/metabolite transporter superfamily protein YnfA